MPPEFFNDGRGQYSKAFDVYSLGTVIKEILAGAAAVSIYGGCVVPLEKVIYNKEIIDVCLIQRDIYIIILLQCKQAIEYWEQRLEEAADVQRFKACVELVPLCWGFDRKKRPTIERILDTLKAVWLKHGAVVDSLKFSYTDGDGREHHAGPWGSPDAWDKVLQLEPYEFLVSVSGTMGAYAGLPTKVISSLTFVTNVKTYRTRGVTEGDPFELEAPAGSCIVGFRARAGDFLDALAVYHRPISHHL